MSPEVQAPAKSPEISPDAKKILRELGDNPIAKEFIFNLKYSGIDMDVCCQGNRENFIIDVKRPFFGGHERYVFEESQFSQVIADFDSMPGTPFSRKESHSFTPEEVHVTEDMILFLIKQVKEDEKNFNKRKA